MYSGMIEDKKGDGYEKHIFKCSVWRYGCPLQNSRERMRFRGDLLGLQTMVKNRMHSIFHRHGIFHEFSDLFGGKGRMFLFELCLNGSEYLSPESLLALRGQVKLLDHIRRQVADVARILHKDLQTTPLNLGDRGNRTLKWPFIEAAHGAVRSSNKTRSGTGQLCHPMVHAQMA